MRSGFLFRYSNRNLWRNPRRTLLMLVALILGVGFLVLIMNFSRSGVEETRKDFLKHFTGELTYTHREFFPTTDLTKFDKYKLVSDSDFSPSVLKETAPRILSKVYVSGKKKTIGILMVGIEPRHESDLSTLHQSLSQGDYLSPNKTGQIVLGKKLARIIGVEVGDDLAVIGQANDGSILGETMRVSGLLDLGGADTEATLGLVLLSDAQRLLAMGNSYHERIAFEKKPISTSEDLRVTSWEELLPEVASSMRFSIVFLKIICILMTFLICVSLANNFMISFLHREKEFLMLQVLGTSSSWITRSLLVEGLLMMGTGVLLGLMLGSALTWVFYTWPIDMQVLNGGNPLILGGMKINPKVRVQPYLDPYWVIPLQVIIMFGLAMIYPMMKVVRKNRTRFSQSETNSTAFS